MTKNKKHFRATNKTNPEDVVEFGLEDIYCNAYYTMIDRMGGQVPLGEFWIHHTTGKRQIETDRLKDWLKDYDLYYYHDGEWFPYNTEEVEK